MAPRIDEHAWPGRSANNPRCTANRRAPTITDRRPAGIIKTSSPAAIQSPGQLSLLTQSRFTRRAKMQLSKASRLGEDGRRIRFDTDGKFRIQSRTAKPLSPSIQLDGYHLSRKTSMRRSLAGNGPAVCFIGRVDDGLCA